ncbi:MAG: hypothetical protein ABJN98_01935 [Roseibium sp.]
MNNFSSVYKITDFIFKAVILISSIFTAILVCIAIALDYINYETSFLSLFIINRFGILDIPESDIGKIAFDFESLYRLLVFLLVLILVASFAVIWRKSDRVKNVSKLFQQFSSIYSENLSDGIATIQKIERSIEADKSSGEHEVDRREMYDSLVSAGADFLVKVCNRLEAIAFIYTGNRCAVNIKILSAHSGQIRTIARDHISYEQRKITDQKYEKSIRSYKNNSAYRTLVNNRSQLVEICNNVNNAERKGEYENDSNENRRDFYNSFMVVPINLPSSKIDSVEIIGFICVDSLGAKFKKDYLFEIILIISKLISVYFRSVASVINVNMNRGNEDG